MGQRPPAAHVHLTQIAGIAGLVLPRVGVEAAGGALSNAPSHTCSLCTYLSGLLFFSPDKSLCSVPGLGAALTASLCQRWL